MLLRIACTGLVRASYDCHTALCDAELEKRRDLEPRASLRKKKILGVGTAALDYIAYVSRYPKPDEKVRAESIEIGGGTY